MQYNIWFALAYEITNFLINQDTKWEINPWVKSIREYCKQDWVEWRTEATMKSVDFQVETIKQQWDAEENGKYVKPIVVEHKPDGSKAQELLGGALEIKAPFYDSSNH